MNLEELRKLREKGQREMMQRSDTSKYRIVVGMGTSGIAAGAREVLKAFIDEINAQDIKDVIVMQTGEKGFSSREPVVEVFEEGSEPVLYGNINPEKAKRIVEEHIGRGNIIKDYQIIVGK